MRPGLQEEFNLLLISIQSGQYVGDFLDLRKYKIDIHDIDNLLDALPYSPSIKKVEMGDVSLPFSKFSRLKQILRNEHSPSDPKKELIPEKDEYDNPPRAAIFETKLARAIIENSSFDVLHHINKAIIDYIENNTSIKIDIQNELTGIKGLLLSEKLISSMVMEEDPVEVFKKNLMQKPLDITTCITLHKIFFENFFDPTLIHNQLINKKMMPLGLFAQNKLREKIKNSDEELKSKWENILRPEDQFSETNRGRRGIGNEASSRDFGITDEENTPLWAKNWHKKDIFPAKNVYRRDLNSPIMKVYEKYRIPFIAGPAGTVGFVVGGAILLLGLTAKQLKEYVNLLAAAEIALGHHSYHETMMVASNLKLFYFAKETAIKLFESSKKKATLTLSSSIDPQHLYDQYLTEEFKKMEAHQTLALEYPDYLHNENTQAVKKLHPQ